MFTFLQKSNENLKDCEEKFITFLENGKLNNHFLEIKILFDRLFTNFEAERNKNLLKIF